MTWQVLSTSPYDEAALTAAALPSLAGGSDGGIGGSGGEEGSRIDTSKVRGHSGGGKGSGGGRGGDSVEGELGRLIEASTSASNSSASGGFVWMRLAPFMESADWEGEAELWESMFETYNLLLAPGMGVIDNNYPTDDKSPPPLPSPPPRGLLRTSTLRL
jgi:hypothetical protein